jgi:hypothetical protein
MWKPRAISAVSKTIARPDIVVYVVRQLVGQDHFDLVVRIVSEQRIGQEDPSRSSESGQCGVRLSCAIAEAPLERSEHRRTGTIGERRQPRRQCSRSSGLTS